MYSETLYKDTLFKQIKEIIGDPQSFKKNNKSRRINIANRLSELCILANHTSVFNVNNTRHKLLESEYDEFSNNFKEYIERIDKRANSSNISNKIDTAVYQIHKYLKTSGYIDEDTELTGIKNKLNGDHIFNICILSATSLIKYDHSIKGLQSEPNEILHIKFIDNLTKNILINLCSLIIEGNIQTSAILIHIIDNHIKIINSINELRVISYQISDIFEECIVENTRNVSHTNNKSLKLIQLPEKLLSSYIMPTHIPMIIEPDITYDNVYDYILTSKSISNGSSKVNYSSETRRALMNSQKKKFTINPNAIELFKLLDELPYDDIKNLDSLPFTPISHLKHLHTEIKNIKSNISVSILKSINYEFLEIKKNNNNIEDIHTYMSEKINEPVDVIKLHMDYYIKEKDYKERIMLRKLHNTTIKFAEIFIGFPLYFINTHDYRLRMYPYSYFFSRTTGIYKYLVSEYEYTKLSSEGYITMIKAYIKNFQDRYDHLGDISVKNIEHIKNVFKPVELKYIINNSSYFYYYLLGNEIYNMRNNNKSNFMIEIDQKSSSAVFLSIILGDVNLASKCNLTSSISSDPATILMNESSEYYNNNISSESLEILKYNRKIHKFLLMCFCYNQGYYGRSIDIREYISCEKDIYYISKSYPDFIDKIFNNLSIKKNRLNNIIKFYLESSGDCITIDTLDGSKISWSIFYTKNITKKKKYKSMTCNGYKSYSERVIDTERSDVKKVIRGLIPSLIHSMDGSIIRLIINRVYDEHKYIINHLHDSIQFHPNNYKIVLDSISYVYINTELYNALDKCLLDNLRNNLLTEDRKIFDELVETLKNDYNEIKIMKETFKPEVLYPFE